jgi:hypothetical protein
VVNRLVSADSVTGELASLVITDLDKKYPRKSDQTVSLANYKNSSGVADQTSFAAAASAAGAGGTIFIPSKIPVSISAPVRLVDINLVSDNARVAVTTNLGDGIAALTVHGSGAHPFIRVEGFRLDGPSVTLTRGVAPTGMHGIEVTGRAKTRIAVTVRFFNRGVVYRSDNGHLFLNRSNLTANYYGLYLAKNTSDYFIDDCELNGNMMAGIAMPADQGFDGAGFGNSHCGFQPYGILQEATTESGSTQQGSPRVFIQDAIFSHVRFEAIGNGAIVSLATNDANNKSVLNAVKIIQPGFSWASDIRLPNMPRDYAIDVGFLSRTLDIDSGAFPFLPGDLGVIRVKQADTGSAIVLRGATGAVSASQVTIDVNAAGCAVSAGLTALVAVPTQKYAPGVHYSAAGTRAVASRPNGFTTFLPFRVDGSKTFTGLGVEINGAGESGSKVRLGVYADGAGMPGPLVVDAGQVSADTTGLKSITGLAISLSNGWYYLAATVQAAPTTAPTMRTVIGVVAGAPMSTAGGQLSNGAGWQQPSVGQGVYPSPVTGVGPADTVVGVSIIG